MWAINACILVTTCLSWWVPAFRTRFFWHQGRGPTLEARLHLGKRSARTAPTAEPLRLGHGGGFKPFDGGFNRACVGRFPEDLAVPFQVYSEEVTIEECKSHCAAAPVCWGIGYSHNLRRCEVWYKPAVETKKASGHACLEFTSNSTATATSTTLPPGCALIDPGHDYPGGDLSSVRDVADPNDCCTLCGKEANCTSWTWVERICYLKNQQQFRRQRSLVFTVSGVAAKEHKLKFQIWHRYGLCLGSDPPDGGLRMVGCKRADRDLQNWTYHAAEGILSPTEGVCLDVLEARWAGRVGLRICEGSTSQQWTYDWTSGLIQSQSSGYCIGATGFRIEDSEILLWHCDAFSRSQQWRLWNTAMLDQNAIQLAVELDKATLRLDSLFCVTLLGPTRSEGDGNNTEALLGEMKATGTGIFACEEFAVYSNPVIKLGSYRTRLLDLDLGPLARKGKWTTRAWWKEGLGDTAHMYQKLWERVVADGRYAYHAWTVKVAPDAVFLPARLREALRGPELQEPQSGNGIFLQSCLRAVGLHGALEALSRRALEAFVEGRERCNKSADSLLKEEASWLQSCLLRLGTTRVEQFGLLASEACGSQQWSQCRSHAAVFHPFDSVDALRRCMAAANVERTE